MKIVIVSHSGIGNLIHTTPCAIALRRMGYEVVICTWPRSARILEGWDKARVVIDHPAVHTINADHVIVSKCGAIWQDEWTKGRVWRAGPDKNPWTKHEIEYYIDVANALGYGFWKDIPKPETAVNKQNRILALLIMERHGIKPKEFICINASYLHKEHWKLKNWGSENYSRLIYKLNKIGYKCVLVGSKEDRNDAQKILNEFDLRRACAASGGMANFDACGLSDDIRDTAAIIEQAVMTIGNDGGLQHVSAAVDTPTMTIFTFTNPVKNRPWNGALSKEVMVSCDLRASCQHGEWKRCGQYGCLDVPFEEVWDATRKFIEDLRSGGGSQDATPPKKHI